jgi:signal transduction histidine kinase
MTWLPGMFNSIFARIMALTFILLLVSAAALTAVLQTPLSGRLFDRAIGESAQSVAELVWLLETSPFEVEDAVLSIYAGRSRAARITPAFATGLRVDDARRGLLLQGDSAVTERLRDRDVRFRTLGLFELRALSKREPLRPYYAASALNMAIGLKDGRVLSLWLAPSIFYTDGRYAFAFLTAVIAIVTLVLGLAIHWVVMRPIRALERDAEIVGLAQTAIPVSETGPRELRRLSRALNRMRARLAGLVREREQIMVAIAHDIRTGLTKLRLRMDGHEKLSPRIIEPDIAQMEHLLADMMAYARAETLGNALELIELCELVSGLVRAAPYRVLLDYNETDRFFVAGNALALTRLFDNLLENARRYGAGHVEVRIVKDADGLIVDVLDDGPGIPDVELDRIFEPFARGESSRNRDTGGTGLGLAIARAIAQTHGAGITLANRPAGGLCARTRFSNETAA